MTPYDAGTEAYRAVDTARSELAQFRRLFDRFGADPAFQQAWKELGLSEKLTNAYLDAAKILQERGF